MNFYLKITASLTCLLLNNAVLKAQDAFTLTIKVNKPMPGYKAFLNYKTGPETNGVDSGAYDNGKFEIKARTLKPQRAFVYLAPANKGFQMYNVTLARIPVYLEAGHITVAGTEGLKAARLSGTPLNDDFQGFIDVRNSYNPQLDALREKYGKANQAKDSESLKTLAVKFTDLENETKKAEERYFMQHLSSPASLDWLKTSFNLAKEKSKITALFTKMNDKVKKSDSGKAFGETLTKTLSVGVGLPAPDFIVKNISAETVSLASFRGKYVLLDFWASWCVPCRKENPNVLQAYNTYKDKNFTVVGYSVDLSKKSWEKAVEHDALPWTQLGRFDTEGSLPDALYGISAIPSNFLIDPKGKIIAMDLRGEELQKKLASILN